MSDTLITTVQNIYAAFGRGDIPSILTQLTDDISWEFEAPSEITWGGCRRGPNEVAGFFAGLAIEHINPTLDMTEFFSSEDAVAAFGRYEATLRSTGAQVSTPVAHYFKFRDGKICRYMNLINTGAFVEAAKPRASAAIR